MHIITFLGIVTFLANNGDCLHLNYPVQNPLNYGRLSEIYPDEGEPVSIQFVTRLRHRREVSTKEYHILRVHITSREETFDIHLTRNDNIDQLSQPNGQEEQSQGLFTGTISNSKDKQGSTGYKDSNDVSVALSLSTHEDGGVEVNGYMILEHGHFVIEPSASTTFGQAGGLGETQHPHQIFNVYNLIKKENVTQSDVLHVPRDELEKAYKEMENSTDNPDSSDTSEDTTDPPSTLTLDVGDDTDQNDVFSLETFANNGKIKTPKKSKPVATKQASKSETIVEIAAFTDAKLYALWTQRYPKDPKTSLKNFVLTLINQMQLLYHHQSLGMALSFRLVHLELLTAKPASVNEHSGDAGKYLHSFCDYAGQKNDKGKNWDHSLLLTGYDIQEGGEILVAGLAYFSTMCLRYLSCSITEGFGFGTTFTLTHELGHSLGMEHDGEKISAACNKEKYIMSPSTGPGKVTWSTCSSQNIKEFIKSGNPDLTKKDVASIPKCLTRSSPLKNHKINFAGKKLPGQVYSTKVQCQLDCGNNCVPNPIQSGFPNHNTDICNFLWCDMFFEKDGQQMLQSKGAHPALEGTPCGTGKHCRYGKCIKIKSR